MKFLVEPPVFLKDSWLMNNIHDSGLMARYIRISSFCTLNPTDSEFAMYHVNRDTDPYWSITHDNLKVDLYLNAESDITGWYLSLPITCIPMTKCKPNRTMCIVNDILFVDGHIVDEYVKVAHFQSQQTYYFKIGNILHWGDIGNDINKPNAVFRSTNRQINKFVESLFSDFSTRNKGQQMKKYLKDNTVYNFPIAGSVEVQLTKRPEGIYLLNTELVEDNRPEAEVMREKVIAELKAKLPPDTPEWGKQMLAIFEEYQRK